jgi:hypothetical protein
MLNNVEKEVVKALKHFNIKWKDISKYTGHTENSLKHFWRSYVAVQEIGPKPVIKKRITDGRVGLQIKAICSENPRMSIRDIEVELRKRIEPQTPTPKKSEIGRFLALNDLKMIKLKKKPLISNNNKWKRLNFAAYGIDNLEKLQYETLWSDETMVRKCPKDKEIYVRAHQSMQWDNLPLNYQIQNGGFSVMFWGCFSVFGTGPLVALEGNQNQHTYKKLLED